MHCFKCGTALPSEAATCPACGAATPYNVTATTPEIAGTRLDSATIDNTDEGKAPPVSQVGETPPVERTMLQQPPQMETPAPQVERTVLQQPSQADQPGQQLGSPQPALPATSPAWQQPQPMQGQPTPQPGATQAQQGQPWPQPFPGQQPLQQGSWPQQPGPSQPLGPQSYPAWQPRPGMPHSMPGPQALQPGLQQPQQGQPWAQPFPGQQPLQQVSWQPQPLVGQPQMQSSPVWQQPQVGMAQPLPGQRAQQRRGFSLAMILLLIIITLVIIGTSGLIYYTADVHPANLHAQATSVAQDFLTVQARSLSPEGIYAQATSGRPVINDPLSSPNNSSWQNGFGCTFTAGAYHVTVQQVARTNTCLARGTFNNFAFQVQMTIINGPSGGLIFRSSRALEHYYIFWLTTSGVYSLALVEEGATQQRDLTYNSSPAIKTGPNQPNLLTVIARGSNIYLYINKQFVASVNDGTYSSGAIALEATPASFANPSTDIAFSNAQVWKL